MGAYLEVRTFSLFVGRVIRVNLMGSGLFRDPIARSCLVNVVNGSGGRLRCFISKRLETEGLRPLPSVRCRSLD